MEVLTVKYIPRLIEGEIKCALETNPALVIEGPRWCGKTTTAKQFAKSALMLSDPSNDFENRARAQLDPKLAITGKHPRLLDEWQEVPKLWDAVRFNVDDIGKAGMYILTGSATPRDKNAPMHTGTGRFSRVKMSTMTLQELNMSTCRLSISALVAQTKKSKFDQVYLGSLDAKTIAEILVRGGWPGVVNFSLTQAKRVARDYLDAICESDISSIDDVKRDPVKVRATVRSLARCESSYASITTITKDVGSFVSRQTIAEYLMLLNRLHVCDDISPWNPALRSPVKMRAAKKHHLSDPSLAVSALGASVDTLLDDFKTLGFLFESLVLHDLSVYASCCGARLHQYHDASGLEVDAIIEAANGDWIPVEIKLGAVQTEKACQALNKLEHKIVSAGNKPPLTKLVIYGFGVPSALPENGFIVAPIDALCA